MLPERRRGSRRPARARANTGPQGFTMVELLVAMIAAPLLSLTIGTMLHYFQSGWKRHAGAVEFQRDATLAMNAIARAVRSAPAGAVSNSAGRLTILAGAGAGTTFYQRGADLVRSGDVNGTAPDVVLVSGRLSTFAASNTTSGVRIAMTLHDGPSGEDARIESVIRTRN
jgi:prepilin-type N-terminal cleavage/methylation domain-containing protein